jgi:hypothetical protein
MSAVSALELLAASLGCMPERRNNRSRGPYVRGPQSKRDSRLPDGRGKWERWKTSEERAREKNDALVRRLERDERLRERDVVLGPRAAGTGRSRKVRRAAARLARLPPSRVCPRCGLVVVASRRWVVPPGWGVATCLSCHRKRGG